jgi:hypothetical protein
MKSYTKNYSRKLRPEESPSEPSSDSSSKTPLELAAEAYAKGCDEKEAYGFVAQSYPDLSPEEFSRMESLQVESDPQWKATALAKSHAMTANAKITLADALRRMDDPELAKTVLERRKPQEWSPRATLEVVPPGSNALTAEEVMKLKEFFPKAIDAQKNG